MAQHSVCAFATATYSPEGYPADRAALLRDYRKLYRLLKGAGVRSMIVGERGSRTGRVHFHVLAMGVEPLALDPFLSRHWDADWKKGFVNVSLDPARSANYLGKYVYKSVLGRGVEALHSDGFGVMPCYYLRGPALGCGVVPKLAAMIARAPQAQLHEVATGDVIGELSMNGRSRRMPRPIKTRLRAVRGIPSQSPVRQDFASLCDSVERANPEVLRRREARCRVMCGRLSLLAAREHSSRLYLDPGYRAAVAEFKRREELGLPIPGQRKRRAAADRGVRWHSDRAERGGAGCSFNGRSVIRDAGPGSDLADPLSGVWK